MERVVEVLLAAVVTITLALAFYSWGVWAEKIRGILTWRHVVAFSVGLICDAAGTAMMAGLASRHVVVPAADAFNVIMKWTGGAAITLMGLHLGWAIVVLLRNHANELARFHHLSVIVWSFWLIPYAAGAIAANLPH